MCDELTNKDAEEYLRRHALTRREFGKRGAGVALAMMLPPVANALDVTEQDVLVETPDGMADCYFVHPSSGEHAAVIIWPDIVGIRPAFRAMGKRLAESGYSVLVVNPYYRTVKGAVVPEGKTFRDPGIREMLMPHARTLSPATCVSDGRAFVEYLDNQTPVDTARKIGTTGYCMTGSYTMRLAAAIPNRIGAGGSFHGGGLVTDSDDSPHLLIPQMNAGFLIAIAENDHEKSPDTEGRLRTSFDDANVAAEVEVYKGTLHGWCPPDSAVYNEEEAERAWSKLLDLFDRELS
jgi:carboxymethylenebutenolidase